MELPNILQHYIFSKCFYIQARLRAVGQVIDQKVSR